MIKHYLLSAFIALFFLSHHIANAALFTNSTPIVINDNASANPYPSVINVTGMSGTISNVSVTINGLTHSWVHDVSIILQAPSGESLLLQSGTADGQSVAAITYTISDAGAAQFSNSNLWANNGIMKPTGYFWDIWTAPAPPTPPGVGTYNTPGPFGGTNATFASTFNGLSANGGWKLFVADFASGDAGQISNGWTLNITTANAPLPLTLNYFYVSPTQYENNLFWKTTDQKNFSHFEIEYCTDNKNFTLLDKVEAMESLNNTNLYSYTHHKSKHDNAAYYRLKMIDKDGRYSYSQTAYVKGGISLNGTQLYPTIIDNKFTISSDEIISKVTVKDLYGNVMLNISPNTSLIDLYRSTLPFSKGIYIIQVQNTDGKIILTQKVLFQ